MAVSTRTIALAVSVISFAAITAFLAASAPPAGGQTRDATIDVTVRYPNGDLVTDFDVCIGFGATVAFGPVTSTPAFSGTQRFTVGGNCLPATNPLPTVTWHNGEPVGSRLGGIDPGWTTRVIEPFVVLPGSNEITVTVGASRLAGTVTGTPPLEAGRCSVRAIGTSAISGNFASQLVPVAADGTWEIWMHPGEYTVETACPLRSAYEAWPNQSRVVDATSISLTNGEERTGLDFDLSDRFDRTTGMYLHVGFANRQEQRAPKCVEAYDLDGVLVRRTLGPGVSVAENGSYRLRVTDCIKLGFEDQWLPEGASRTSGPSILVDGSAIEVFLIGSPLGGGLGECNGLEITISGTRSDDVIEGTPGPDVISGLSGNDTILALGGGDTVCGGSGNDVIEGNAGADWADGGNGDDLIRGGWGEDELYGGAGNDFIRSFRHDDFVDGGAGNDIIRGGWGSDVLRGGSGDDRIIAWNGADRVFGDAGNDLLRAGPGPDFVVGGPGAGDRIFGDEGTRDACFDVGASTIFRDCEEINGE